MKVIFFSLSCAVFYALHSVYVKKLTRAGRNEYFLLWATMSCAIPFLLTPFFFHRPPPVNMKFGISLFFAITFNLLNFTLYFKAIKYADISLVMPIVSLSPLFMLFTSHVMLGEFPDARQLIGILLVTCGIFHLTTEGSWKKPFSALKNNPGAPFALAVSFLWSISANVDKLCVIHYSPHFYPIFFSAGFMVLYIPVVRRNGGFKRAFAQKGCFKEMFLLGTLHGIMILSQMIALEIAIAPVVITVKRAGMLLSVLFGWLFFRESYGRRRFMAALIVFLGLVFILYV